MADRKGERLTVSVIDVNGFKTIKDTYGHEAGDRVLQVISTTLCHTVRKSDIVARWGGDEFIIMVLGTDKDGTLHMIKRIQAGLEQASESLQKCITVSTGIAIYPDEAQTLDDLLKVADHRMYKLKPNQK